jgi:hypothetical protein
VSRSRLSLFTLDRGALDAFSAELRAALASDDRTTLVRLLALGGDAAAPVLSATRSVDVFLAPESYAPSAPALAALRDAARGRALGLAWTSESLALEGRLRGFEALRDDPELAGRVDALLDGAGVPWFLRRAGGSFGTLSAAEREALASGMADLDDPPPELVALGEALSELSGDVLCHDGLAPKV